MYVAYYRNAAWKLCVRKITRGFACTQAELPQEMKTRCRAANTPIWDYYDSERAMNAIIEDAVTRLGYINETPKQKVFA